MTEHGTTAEEQAGMETNRRSWDERAGVHVASSFYGVERYVEDPTFLSEVVRHDQPALGDVASRSMLHLQCHIGTDTLSWARLGADVTGLDFSPEALRIARDLAARAGQSIDFVEGNVLDAPSLVGRRFDVVYASIGVLCWIPSVRDWAQAAAGCLEPGGTLYLRDGHPFLSTFEWERDDDLLVCSEPYFESAGPLRYDDPATYTDGPTLEASETVEWAHGVGEIVNAFVDAGLVIERLDEHTTLPWQAFPWMVPVSDDEFGLPEGRHPVPMTLAVTARRPD